MNNDSFNANQEAKNNAGSNPHRTGEAFSQTDQFNVLLDYRDPEKSSETSSATKKLIK